MKTELPSLRLFAGLLLVTVTSWAQQPGPGTTAPPAGRPATPVTPKISERKLEQIHRDNRRKAEEMMARDNRLYSAKEMADLEQTYQIANKNTRSPEAMEALKKVLEKYDKSNRAGCAALYLGRWSTGDDREKYLRLAIEKYSKCYYLDGTSVGGYARLILGSLYQSQNKNTAAKKLFDEIRKDYADAEDHGDRLLVELIPN
jgi:hypothetical protein